MMTERQIRIRVCEQWVVFSPDGGGGRSIDFREGKWCLSGDQTPCAEELCGAGKVLWDRGIRENPMTLYWNGIPHLVLCSACEDRVTSVTVQAGQAEFLPRRIPMRFETPLVEDPVTVPGAQFRITALRFGDPYAVIFPETVGDCRLFDRWEEISRLHLFPQGAAVVFAYLRGDTELHLRPYHRNGARDLRGSDICAALAAAVAAGRCLPDRAVRVPLEEGEVRAVCTKDRTLFLTCPVS